MLRVIFWHIMYKNQRILLDGGAIEKTSREVAEQLSREAVWNDLHFGYQLCQFIGFCLLGCIIQQFFEIIPKPRQILYIKLFEQIAALGADGVAGEHHLVGKLFHGVAAKDDEIENVFLALA